MANQMIDKPAQDTYWIAYNADKSLMFSGMVQALVQKVEMDDVIYTLEAFTDKDIAILRADALGIDADEFLDNIKDVVG